MFEKKTMIASAVLAGLVSGMAFADHHEASTAEKKVDAKKKSAKKKGDKDGCSGKNGCGGKDGCGGKTPDPKNAGGSTEAPAEKKAE